jgi:hypothetical protein
MLPEMAAADGLQVHTAMFLFDNANGRHALNAILDGTADASRGKVIEDVPAEAMEDYARRGYLRHANQRSTMYHFGEVLKERRWDAVIVSINTHQAVNRDVFRTAGSPFGYFNQDSLQYTMDFEFKERFFREVLPEAELFIFQNLAPRNDCVYKLSAQQEMLRDRDILPADEVLTEDTWALLSSEHFTRCARELDLKPILPGDLLYWIRRDPAFGYVEVPNHIEAHRLYAQKGKGFIPKWETDLDFRFNLCWRRKDGEDVPVVDHHPNVYGNYLTAALTYEAVAGRSIVGNSYVPTSGAAAVDRDRIALIQQFVHNVSRDPARYPLYPNVKCTRDNAGE